jgi:hypothetical protein
LHRTALHAPGETKLAAATDLAGLTGMALVWTRKQQFFRRKGLMPQFYFIEKKPPVQNTTTNEKQ